MTEDPIYLDLHSESLFVLWNLRRANRQPFTIIVVVKLNVCDLAWTTIDKAQYLLWHSIEKIVLIIADESLFLVDFLVCDQMTFENTHLVDWTDRWYLDALMFHEAFSGYVFC